MRLFHAFALTLVVVSLAAGGVAAQDANATATDATPAGLPDRCTEQVDNQTWLCSASTDGDTVTLELYSTEVSTPVFTDAGAFLQGGEVYQQESRLYPGRTTTVVVPVTEVDGFVGVSIATDDVLYAVPLQEPTPSVMPGSPSITDGPVVGATVFVLFVVLIPLLWRWYTRTQGGERDVF